MNLDLLLGDYQAGHTPFQIDHFIVAQSGDTLYGMYVQALREIIGRLEGFVREKSMTMGRHQELVRFIAIAVALKGKLGDLTPERRRMLDLATWQLRLKKLVAMDLIAAGRVSRGTLETVLSTPKDFRREIVELAMHEPKKLIEWVLDIEPPWQEVVALLDEDKAAGMLDEFAHHVLKGTHKCVTLARNEVVCLENKQDDNGSIPVGKQRLPQGASLSGEVEIL